MEKGSNDRSGFSKPCQTGCGFYGTSSTNGLCSRCFKDLQRSEDPKDASTTASGNESSKCSESPASVGELKTMDTGVRSKKAGDALEVKGSQNPSGENGPLTSDLTRDSSAISPTNEEKSEESIGNPSKRKKSRCHTCRKSLGLLGISCRCGGLYCEAHRYSDKHGCTFDYKALGKEAIQKNNPHVVAEKVKKI